MAVTVAELHGLPPVAAAAVGADGPPLDPQLDSVLEGRHRQSEADPVDENGDAAALLRDLMEARGIPTGVEGHVIPGSLCYDCLQTRGDQIADRVRWEAELEAEFNNAQQEP